MRALINKVLLCIVVLHAITQAVLFTFMVHVLQINLESCVRCDNARCLMNLSVFVCVCVCACVRARACV
jgi:hypothetical protein